MNKKDNGGRTAPHDSASSLDGMLAHAFAIAQAHHQKNELAEAEAGYRQILQRCPDHAGALHYLGAIALQAGALDDACELMERALATEPDNPQLLTNLGSVYTSKNALPRAERVLRKARRLDPGLNNVDGNLAQVLALQGEYEEAITFYERALEKKDLTAAYRLNFLLEMAQCRLKINDKERAIKDLEECVKLDGTNVLSLVLLGRCYRVQRRFPEALDTLLKALTVDTDHHGGYIELIQTFIDIHDMAAAEQAADIGLQKHPTSWQLRSRLSVVYRSTDRLEKALEVSREALKIAPNEHEIVINYANALVYLERLDEAEEVIRRALRLNPESEVTLANLAAVLWMRGDHEESIHYNTLALQRAPDFSLALFNRAIAKLAIGDLEEGWKLFEHGILTGQRAPKYFFPAPLWKEGEDLADKTLLIRREQGVGDEAMYASMYSELIGMAKHCIIETVPKMQPLITRSFPAATVMCTSQLIENPDVVNSADRQILIGSVPARLRPTFADFPSPNAYLRADPDRVREYRTRLDALPGRIKIAVSWRSRVINPSRDKFYLSLEELAPILSLPDTCFVSLQYDDHPETIRAEVEAAASSHGVKVHIIDGLDTLDDLDGVAAVIEACDLVIGACTTVNRIAGGIGKPTIEATPGLAEQHLGQLISPFTPSVRIVKPPVAFDKATTVRMLEDEVRAFIATMG